eukprot:scaffold8641_cov134-Isochrysis_galbana.AAC.18
MLRLFNVQHQSQYGGKEGLQCSRALSVPSPPVHSATDARSSTATGAPQRGEPARVAKLDEERPHASRSEQQARLPNHKFKQPFPLARRHVGWPLGVQRRPGDASVLARTALLPDLPVNGAEKGGNVLCPVGQRVRNEVLELACELEPHGRPEREVGLEQHAGGREPKVDRDTQTTLRSARVQRGHLVPPVGGKEENLARLQQQLRPRRAARPGEGRRASRVRRSMPPGLDVRARPLLQVDLRARVERMVHRVGVQRGRLHRVEDAEALGAGDLDKEVVILVEMQDRPGPSGSLGPNEELAAYPCAEASGGGARVQQGPVEPPRDILEHLVAEAGARGGAGAGVLQQRVL